MKGDFQPSSPQRNILLMYEISRRVACSLELPGCKLRLGFLREKKKNGNKRRLRIQAYCPQNGLIATYIELLLGGGGFWHVKERARRPPPGPTGAGEKSSLRGSPKKSMLACPPKTS